MAIGYEWTNIAQIAVSRAGQTVTFYIDVKLNSQSITGNYSVVDTRLTSTIQGGLSGSSYSFTLTGANSISGSVVWVFENETILTGQTTIYHNDDGTKVGSASAYCYNGYWSINETFNGSFTLPTIARASVPTINPNPFNIGSTITINTNRKSSSFTHTMSLSIGSYTYNIGSNIGESIALDTSTIANNLYQQITTSTSGTITITCTTYNGTTAVGTTTSTFTANVVDSYPTFTPEYADINPTTKAITDDDQYIIRNKSNLQISITNASAKNYATLTRLYAWINGTLYEGELRGNGGVVDIGLLDISSNIDATVGVIDSRGYGTEMTLPITILDWQQPSAIINLQRENNYYTTTNINVDANYSSLNGWNTISIKVRYKKTSEQTYGAYTTLADGVTSQLTLDNLYSWDVQVLIEDALASTTYNTFLDKGLPIIFFDRLKQSVSIECFPINNNSLEVNGVDVANKYDTTEIVIGTWMGKPVYRKVVPITELPGSTTPTVLVAHEINNFEYAISLRGFYLNGTTTLLLPFISDYDVSSQITLSINDTDIVLLGGLNYQSSITGFIIVEYTKTTD